MGRVEKKKLINHKCFLKKMDVIKKCATFITILYGKNS